jgi:hypothetical protein
MQREAIDDELKNAAFEYFFWYSRFEFALKENKYLKSFQVGSQAEACWKKLEDKYKTQYQASNEARQLIRLHPKRQIVSEDGGLTWQKVGISHCSTDLCKVIAMLKTIRNNLFHGGKHGDAEVDDKQRNLKLLTFGKAVLDQLAKLADFESDYKRYY